MAIESFSCPNFGESRWSLVNDARNVRPAAWVAQDSEPPANDRCSDHPAGDVAPSTERRRACSSAAALLLDEGGAICWTGRTAAAMLGRASASLCGQPITALLPDLPLQAGTPGYNAAFVALWFSDRPRVLAAVDGRGDRFDVEVSIGAVRFGEHRRFLVTLERPCGRASAPADLQRYLQAVERSPDAVAVTDLRGMVSFVNPAFAALTGYRPSEVVGRFVYQLTGGDGASSRRLAQLREGAQTAAMSRGPMLGRRRDGSVFHADESVRPFVDSRGRATHYVFTLRDASARVGAAQRLAHLAHHDALTGLPNRTLFADRMQRQIAHCTRNGGGFALLWLDLDQFKAINDQLGHAAGDEVLRVLAHRLRLCVREEDTVARLGGDEFAIILADARRCQGTEVAVVALGRAVARDVSIDGVQVSVTASIGVACFPDDGRDEPALLRAADQAMYRAKSAGGNHRCFPESPTAQLDAGAAIERVATIPVPEGPK